MLWLKTITTVDELRGWVIGQLADSHGARNHRFSLLEGQGATTGAPWLYLSRHERRSYGKPKEERVTLDTALGRRLLAVWPTSPRTGGRAPQTPARILELLGGARAVAQAEREARARQAQWAAERSREHALEAAAEQALPDYQERYAWLHTRPLEALGNETPAWAARASDEGLAAALAILAPMIEAREAAERAANPPFQVIRGNGGRR